MACERNCELNFLNYLSFALPMRRQQMYMLTYLSHHLLLSAPINLILFQKSSISVICYKSLHPSLIPIHNTCKRLDIISFSIAYCRLRVSFSDISTTHKPTRQQTDIIHQKYFIVVNVGVVEFVLLCGVCLWYSLSICSFIFSHTQPILTTYTLYSQDLHFII